MASLRQQHIPATLSLNSRWITANQALAKDLAGDPLFEIGNHGTSHGPLSVTGRSAYGIPGTRNPGEVYDEIMTNDARLTELTGKRPRFFKPGTAHMDEVSAAIVRFLGLTRSDSPSTATPAPPSPQRRSPARSHGHRRQTSSLPMATTPPAAPPPDS